MLVHGNNVEILGRGTNIMKKITLSVIAAMAISATPVFAMTADEIVNNYIENTGGAEAWGGLTGVKYTAEMSYGAVKLPMEIVQLKDGRTYTKITFQGKEFMQGVFDGNDVWGTNQMTMKAEKMPSEVAENIKLAANDFPMDLFNYEAKGYGLELVGEETIDGAETYKLKLTKEPHTIEGKKVDDVMYYYFDSEAMVPLVTETEIKSGQGKGRTMQIKSSDYQEVNGLYFPFANSQGVKGGPSQPITITKIELNPTVDDSVFEFPAQEEAEATKTDASK